MLRLLALCLVLANAAYLAWSQGWLAGYGLAPAVQAEPQRLAQQIRPEAMRLLSAVETRQLDGGVTTASPTSGRPAAPECLQAGPFTEEQAGPLRTRLQTSLPAGSWSLEPAVEASRWMVYMGRYSDSETMSIKRSELRRIGVAFDPLTGPVFGPGLSLGRFDSQAEAQTELVRLAQRGVRSARVVQERTETRGQLLTVPAADATLKAMLDAVKPQLAGKVLLACR